MDALHALTVDYLKTRQQFGVAIGSFQSLQHKAVDMMIAQEQARSMALYAAMMVDAEDDIERRVALSAVKVQINRSARFVGQTAVQLHGGIGMTMEYIGAHHFRRLGDDRADVRRHGFPPAKRCSGLEACSPKTEHARRRGDGLAE